MPLTLRPTGLSSPAYRDWLDYVILEDGREVSRLYEDRHSHPERRWFWSITIYFATKPGITTNGREACRTASIPAPRPLYLNVEFAFVYCGPKGPVVGPSRS